LFACSFIRVSSQPCRNELRGSGPIHLMQCSTQYRSLEEARSNSQIKDVVGGRTKRASQPATRMVALTPFLPSACAWRSQRAKSSKNSIVQTSPDLFGLEYICKKYPIPPINSLGSSFFILLLESHSHCHVRVPARGIAASCSDAVQYQSQSAHKKVQRIARSQMFDAQSDHFISQQSGPNAQTPKSLRLSGAKNSNGEFF